ncbi:MAG: hypothetical protein U0795_12155 [Pirellulales bacterium]
MAKQNRADIIKKLHKVLKKHFTPVPTPHDRTVLEHVLFACCLEDTRHELAEECFARVQQMYFDWNEIRVTTTRELSEVFTALPDPMAAATRLKSSLQSIFETRYEFDLEFLKKMKLGDAQKKLASLRGPSLFVQSYVTQASLGGHAIPTSAGSLQVLELVGAATSAEVASGSVPGLDRAIPKNQGVEFGSLLHTLGSLFTADPKSAQVKSLLAEVNSEAVDRLAKLLARKAAPPEPVAAPTHRRSDKPEPKGPETAKPAEKGSEKPKGAPTGKAAADKPAPAAAGKQAAVDKSTAGDKPPAGDKTPAADKGRPSVDATSGEGTAKGSGKTKTPPAVAHETKKPAPAAKPEPGKSADGKATAGTKPSPAQSGPAKSNSAKPNPAKPDPAKVNTAKVNTAKPGAAKPGTAKPDAGKNKSEATKPNPGKPEAAKTAGRKASSPPPKPPTKPPVKKPVEGKSNEGKTADAGASKSKTASKQLTRRKPR